MTGLPALDVRCDFCRGDGMIETEWEPDGEPRVAIRCGECEGTGYVITDAGEDLIAFLRRHWREVAP